MCENLNELNPDDVVGKFELISVDHKLQETTDWSDSYDLVLGSNLTND